MASKKTESMLDDVAVSDKEKRKTRGRSRSILSVDAEESLQLEAKNRGDTLKTRKRSRSRVRRQSAKDDDSDSDEIFRQNLFPDGEAAVACSSSSTPPSNEQVVNDDQQCEDDSSFVSVGGTKPKRKFKRAVLEEDIRMLDRAMRDFTVQSKIGMEAIESLAEIFAPSRPSDRKKVKRAEILVLLEELRESMAKGQERMIAIATNQKTFQDGVGNLLLDALRGTMSSSSNAVPVMPIARAKQIVSGGGTAPSTQKTQNVWDDIDDLFTLMSAGRPAESVERTRFTKDDDTGNSSSTEEDEYRELILPNDSDDDVDAESPSSSTPAVSASDYSKPGQLASAFFGLAISTKVRGRIAPPCIMTSDWLNSAVHGGGATPDGTVDPLPTILVGGGSKKSAQRRAHAHGNTTALSFRRDSNVGAGITEMSNNVRKNMMPSVML